LELFFGLFPKNDQLCAGFVSVLILSWGNFGGERGEGEAGREWTIVMRKMLAGKRRFLVRNCGRKSGKGCDALLREEAGTI
jgi:hypothetical protein